MPYALLSVTDKTGIIEFAKGLLKSGYQILSTGGTAKVLQEGGVQLTLVSAYTGAQEILEGRVKTLHPKVHAGILADHAKEEHKQTLEQIGGEHIAVVAVNLYDFSKAKAEKQALDIAMKSIDIGGPTMLRAAAKNFRHCIAVADPSAYESVLEFLEKGIQPGSDAWANVSQEFSAKVFAMVSDYDQMIAGYFSGQSSSGDCSAAKSFGSVGLKSIKLNAADPIPLRYGENPQQDAAFFPLTKEARFQPLQGKQLSYNNLLDVDAAAQIASEFGSPTDADKTLCVAIVKHSNPCGAAIQVDASESQLGVFKRAYACDPISAFGGIVAINGTVDAQVAAFIRSEKLFVECLVAGGFTDAALAELAPRKNLRLLPWNQVRAAAAPALAREVRSLHGGLLVQEWDAVASEDYKAVTNSIPSDGQKRDMQFAAKIAKCTKSNTLVYAKNGATIAIGAGQMSRIDCVGIAAHKLKHSNLKNAHLVDSPLSFKGAVLASDAFFPFPDVAEESAKLGVSAIIQPGGSKNDQMSIEACNNQGIAMVFSGERHFRH